MSFQWIVLLRVFWVVGGNELSRRRWPRKLCHLGVGFLHGFCLVFSVSPAKRRTSKRLQISLEKSSQDDPNNSKNTAGTS